ncbi:MAG: antibiotic biosynthesis monooxygenase [Chloroflexi bacterium]|nr:antibiotic biosynthesis monooxygenase [Chloroflexota bacterium]MCH7642331.1 antibiotic biosynthesis monooxygenase [Chloroflexota bacterium]
MSIVIINAIEVPEGKGEALEARFRARAGEVENMPGFEGFELLRPVEGESRYFVYTRWESQEAFEAWVRSPEFTRGHAGPPPGQSATEPVATHSSLLSFEVALSVDKPG